MDTPTPAVSRVTISAKAGALLREMAAQHDVSATEFVEALLHYAGSIYNRPGSWEANTPFDFSRYDRRTDEGGYADRWF